MAISAVALENVTQHIVPSDSLGILFIVFPLSGKARNLYHWLESNTLDQATLC